MARGAEVPHPSGWVLRYADRRAELGWKSVVAQARGSATEAWEQLTRDPRRITQRQHRLKGALRSGRYRGRTLEQWQYEVTGSGRLWYLVDDDERTVWLVHAGTGHPKATE
jgi:hypothetical protein